MTLTPAQTIGPFFAHALPFVDGPYAVPPSTPGAIWIRGTVSDGAAEPVPDALIETWQGAQAQAQARGFARCPTAVDGSWAVLTRKPPAVSAIAPHIDVLVFARGLLHRVVTRIYFPDEPVANDADPVLSTVDPSRRATLIAAAADDGYRFDIVLQGERETIFFDV